MNRNIAPGEVGGRTREQEGLRTLSQSSSSHIATSDRDERLDPETPLLRAQDEIPGTDTFIPKGIFIIKWTVFLRQAVVVRDEKAPRRFPRKTAGRTPTYPTRACRDTSLSLDCRTTRTEHGLWRKSAGISNPNRCLFRQVS